MQQLSLYWMMTIFETSKLVLKTEKRCCVFKYNSCYAITPQNVGVQHLSRKCHTQSLSHNVDYMQCLSHTLQRRLCDKQIMNIKDPTSSLSLAALASASAFCFSASAWCLSLLFLECTELAALLVVSRTLQYLRIHQNQLGDHNIKSKNTFPSARLFKMKWKLKQGAVLPQNP